MGLHRLSFVVSVTPLGGVVGFRSWSRRPQGKPHRGWSVLLPCCGYGGDERGPRATPSREGWPKLPSPLDVVSNSLVESSIVARCGVEAPL
jgi:hypothetical protein